MSDLTSTSSVDSSAASVLIFLVAAPIYELLKIARKALLPRLTKLVEIATVFDLMAVSSEIMSSLVVCLTI